MFSKKLLFRVILKIRLRLDNIMAFVQHALGCNSRQKNIIKYTIIENDIPTTGHYNIIIRL